MLNIALPIAIGLFSLALLLNGWRLLRGPSLADRVIALDTLYINALAVLVLIGIRQDSAVYFEGALIISLLGFVGTVVLARYLARGEILR
jgi:multicomponent K+:H+ antiporter subunit F